MQPRIGYAHVAPGAMKAMPDLRGYGKKVKPKWRPGEGHFRTI
jgi:hypothetical protein